MIEAIRHPGESLTLRDMAEICGCSKSAIWLIEQSALRKLRHALEPDFAVGRAGRFGQRPPHPPPAPRLMSGGHCVPPLTGPAREDERDP